MESKGQGKGEREKKHKNMKREGYREGDKEEKIGRTVIVFNETWE